MWLRYIFSFEKMNYYNDFSLIKMYRKPKIALNFSKEVKNATGYFREAQTMEG